MDKIPSETTNSDDQLLPDDGTSHAAAVSSPSQQSSTESLSPEKELRSEEVAGCSHNSASLGARWTDKNQLIELICSGDKAKETVAVKDIETMMRTVPDCSVDCPDDSFNIDTLIDMVKNKIEQMDRFCLENQLVKNPQMSSNERRGWLLVAQTIVKNADIKVLDPTQRDVKFVKFLGLRPLNLMFDKDAGVRRLSVDIMQDLANLVGFNYFVELKGSFLKNMHGLICEPIGAVKETASTCNSVRAAEIAASHEILQFCFDALSEFTKSFKGEFVKEIDDYFFTIILAGMQYVDSALVRESAFGLCQQIANTGMIRELPFALRFSRKILVGLGDSVSNVRITSCLTVKALLSTVHADERDAYYELIIPTLCLSRYYTWDTKFMLLVQSVWKECLGDKGVFYVTRYIEKVVDFYTLCAQSDNTPVKLAAFASIGELAKKIDEEVLSQYHVRLLDALEKGIKSRDWHTTDAAILTFGAYVGRYPVECKPYVTKLMPELLDKLGYPMEQVRKGSSATISIIVTAYGGEFLAEAEAHILAALQGVNKVSKEASSSVVVKGPVPWEKADGSLYLIADLSAAPGWKEILPRLVPAIFNAAHNKGYPEHESLLETICRIIPLLYSGLGKSAFKQNLEGFLSIIFYVVELETDASSYGRMCLDELGKNLGRNILRGRVESFNPRMLRHLDFQP